MGRANVRGILGCGVLGLALLVGCDSEPPKPLVHYDPATPEFYKAEVVPVFRKNCARCHMGMNHKGGLSLQTKAGILKGGETGVDVVPGDPDRSLLVTLVRHEPAHTGHTPEPGPMPDKGRKMKDADIVVLERWVKAGAVMPEGKP